MKAACVRFLWLWLPATGVFLAGLHRAWRTGQADPWNWGVAAAVLLAGVGLLLARRGWPMRVWAALGSVGIALLFCTLAAARPPDPLAALGLLAVGLLAMFGGASLRFPLFGSSMSRTKSAALSAAPLLLALLLLWRSPAQPLHPVPDRPGLAVITGLPLFWDESGQAGPRDAPIIAVLRTRFTILPIDDAAQLAASRARRLLLAQPRSLTPAQMVAIDQWVRAGGTALVLADPLLRWPSALPPGDRRRPPVVATFDSLLVHWGMAITPPDAIEKRHFLPDGALLTVSAMGGLRDSAGQVTAPGDRLILQSRIGRGRVALVPDADLIDDRLWLADPAAPRDPRLWTADTPAKIVQWLGATASPQDRRWMRDAADVILALRWALLAGIIWAIMGAALLRPGQAGFHPGTKREDRAMKGQEND